MVERCTNPTPWHREMRGEVVEVGLELNEQTDGVLALCGAEIERLLARNAALVETLKGAWCPVDNRARVGECQQCGCSAGILIASGQPPSGPPRLIQGALDLAAQNARLRARIESARVLIEEYDRVASIDHVAAKAILWRLTDEQSKEPTP